MYKISYLFLFFFSVIMSSCEKPLDVDIGGTTPINARSIALYKLHLTAVPTDLPGLLLAFGQLVEELGKSEIENIRANSLLISRSWTDDVEGVMDTEYNFPSKENIVKTLLDPSSKDKFLMNIDHQTQYIGLQITPKKCKLELNSFNKFTNIHTLKWLYYLMFCESNFAYKIRSILNTNNIPVFEFCSMVGRIHDKISTVIRNYPSALSTQQIVDGLMLNGIDIDRTTILNYVQVMIEIKRHFRLFEGTLTTLEITNNE